MCEAVKGQASSWIVAFQVHFFLVKSGHPSGVRRCQLTFVAQHCKDLSICASYID